MVKVTEDTLIRFGDVATKINSHIKNLEELVDNCPDTTVFCKELDEAHLFEAKYVKDIVFKAFKKYGKNGGKK